ncbi:MAG: hypothetical protein PHS96_00070 [Anaerolineales bacterium]|nr:hypothetical protein [Anaerolineales bacterium]
MSEDKKASQVQRAGHWLKCPICAGDWCWRREALFSTRAMAFLKLDWTNPRGDCYICDRCRHVLWFYGEDEQLK